MWGRVPLPHTYVNIPMGCVHSAQKPYGLYCFPVSHNAQVPRGLRCSPVSHNAQVPRGLRCSPVSHNAQVPRGLRCSLVSHNAQTPHGTAPIFPGYWNNTQKNPQYGAAPVSTGVWRLDKRAAAPDRHKTGNLKIN